MTDIIYIDRRSKKHEKEKVYGQFFLEMLYGDGIFYRALSFFLLPLVSRFSFFSWLYGSYQKSSLSKHKVLPFIRKFHVDPAEFAEAPESFSSFNDFFIRKLKPECRPMATENGTAVMPADARYLVFPNLEAADGIWVKGKKFSLSDLLGDSALAERYKQGAMAMARLCPVDYHRFHFPCACTPGEPMLINGPLYSVNPLALKRHIEILGENKRVITQLKTRQFGTVLYIEVGATHVGSIVQTYTPHELYAKGEEKGYFEFGGSCLLILFEPGKIVFDADLVEASAKKIEVRGLLGQSLGRMV